MSKKVDQIKPRRSNRQLGISPDPAKLSNIRTKVYKKRLHVEPDNAQEESMHHIGQLEETDKQHNEEERNNQVTDDIREMEETEDERDKQMADDIGKEDKHAEKEIVQPHTGDAHAEKEIVQSHTGDAHAEKETVQTHEEIMQPPKPKKRKGRGPTKMRGVAKHHEDRVEVEWNSIGAHVGKGSVLLSSFLGPLVREYVPVLLDDWRHLDPSTADIMWDEIQGRFNLTEQWQKEVVFSQMGTLWRSSKSRLIAKIKKTNKKEVVELKPSNIESTIAWKKWVKTKMDEEFEGVSEKYRKLRQGQIPHTTSRKGMIRLADEMKKNSSDPSKVSRSSVWVAGHTHSDGRPVRAEFADTIEQIKTIDSEMASTASTSIRDDAVSQVLGRDKPGRLRGMGRGVTATKLAFLQARDAHVHKLEKNQAELVQKLETLQNQIRVLAKGQKPDDVSSSELNSNSSQLVTRCQLLDWYLVEDVVIGEGEVCSTDPTYKVGRIPLGPNAAAVVIKSVIKEDAYIWRPTASVDKLGQAVGMKIAWPADKIIVDSELQSPTPTENHTSVSSALVDIIYDWNMKDVVVAEGRICSTDPKEMVNNIAIGPGAAMVKVLKVVKKDAYLWRPTPDMYLMEHARQEYVVWPIHKIKLSTQPARRSSPKLSSPIAASPGSRSYTVEDSSTCQKKDNNKEKCKLLDLENSEVIIAEGKVLSSNPDDRVHFVPLGPDASKVWVQVVKIGKAKVWKPSAEVEYIEDALGTTVAWPNDKLVFT